MWENEKRICFEIKMISANVALFKFTDVHFMCSYEIINLLQVNGETI